MESGKCSREILDALCNTYEDNESYGRDSDGKLVKEMGTGRGL
jgi:hypothetical protein